MKSIWMAIDPTCFVIKSHTASLLLVELNQKFAESNQTSEFSFQRAEKNSCVLWTEVNNA